MFIKEADKIIKIPIPPSPGESSISPAINANVPNIVNPIGKRPRKMILVLFMINLPVYRS